MTKKKDGLPGGKVGDPYVVSVDVPAPDAISCVIQSGSLPPGLTLTLEEISGTPAEAGSWTFVLWHIDGRGIHVGAPTSYTINVDQ